MLLLSSNQVAPQAAKTTSPPFPRIGGFGGGSSNSFEQMPTGASPTTTSGGNYPPINVRAGLNNNGYGRFHPQFLCLHLCVHSLLCPPTPRRLSVGGTVPPTGSGGGVVPVAGPAAGTEQHRATATSSGKPAGHVPCE